MKKQQLIPFLTLLMAIFFVGNVMGQDDSPKPKLGSGKQGSPNDPHPCSGSTYNIIIEQLTSFLVPNSITVKRRDFDLNGIETVSILIEKTGSSLDDFYHEIGTDKASFIIEDVPQIPCAYQASEIIVISTYPPNGLITETTHTLQLSNYPVLLSNVSSFPNPSTSGVNITYNLSCEADVQIQLYNNTGTLVQNLNFTNASKGNKRARITMPAPGIYTCKIIAIDAPVRTELITQTLIRE